MKHDLTKQVSLFERNFLAFNLVKDKELADKYGIVCIGYSANVFPWGSPIGGTKCAQPFSDKIPDCFYNYITYKTSEREYYFLGIKIERFYISSNKEKAFIDCELGQEYHYKRVVYLIEIKSGNVILMEQDSHFNESSFIEYNEKLYIFYNTEDGMLVFDENFDDAIHCNGYKKIRGTYYGEWFIYNFKNGKYNFFDLEKNLIYQTIFKPCDNISVKCQKNFLNEGLMFTINTSDGTYSLVDLKKDEIIADELDLLSGCDISKIDSTVYDKNFNIVTLNRHPDIKSSNIEPSLFITKGNKIDDLKIYIDKNGKIRIAESIDIPLEDEITGIVDVNKGLRIVNNEKPHNHLEDDETYSSYLTKLKVYFKNGSFNIYEKGKGWMYKDDDEEEI